MTTLGKYELHEQLGKGGFGTVYRATDTRLEREVALKLLHPQLTNDPDFLERFRGEAKLVASLRNPNIVTVYEMDEEEGRAFIAMEYLSGGSLKEKLENHGALPLADCLTLLSQVCSGLMAAHKKNLIHRDIKPGNILFDAEGHAILADFGLAKAVHTSSTSSLGGPGGVGTPAYRAPEIWQGSPPASPATDIYALGCVLFEMLTGQILFDGNSTDVIITKHLIEGPRIPEDMLPEVKSVLNRALAKHPEDRYQDASELLLALQSLQNPTFSASPMKPKPTGPVLDNQEPELEKLDEPLEKPAAVIRPAQPVKGLQQQPESPPTSKTSAQVLAGVVALGIIAALIFFFARPESSPQVIPTLVQRAARNLINNSPSPTETLPADEPTPQPEAIITSAKVLQNLNCRSGPDTAYPIRTVLLENSSVTTLGRNETADWVYIQSSEKGEECWVFASFLELSDGVMPGSLVKLTPLPTAESLNARAEVTNAWSNEEKSKVTIKLSGFTPNNRVKMTKTGMEGQYLGKKWWNVSQTLIAGKTDSTGMLVVKVEFSPSVKVNLIFEDENGRSAVVSIKLP